MKKSLLALTVFAFVASAAHATDLKSYQVTGPVLELTDSTITVQKGSEKWQIARGSAAVAKDIKVGSKVTVQYTMTATSIDAKPAKK